MKECVRIEEKSLGKNHPKYAASLNNLAQLLSRQVRAKNTHFVHTKKVDGYRSG